MEQMQMEQLQMEQMDTDWVKQYEEETNLRCHLIIDNSSSMHYPTLKDFSINHLNKISF